VLNFFCYLKWDFINKFFSETKTYLSFCILCYLLLAIFVMNIYQIPQDNIIRLIKYWNFVVVIVLSGGGGVKQFIFFENLCNYPFKPGSMFQLIDTNNLQVLLYLYIKYSILTQINYFQILCYLSPISISIILALAPF